MMYYAEKNRGGWLMPGESSGFLGLPTGCRCMPALTFNVTRRSSERLGGERKVVRSGSGQQHDSGAVTNENVNAREGRMLVEIVNYHSHLVPSLSVEDGGRGGGGWRKRVEDGSWQVIFGLHSKSGESESHISHTTPAAPDIGLRFSVQQNGEIRIENVVKGSPAHMALQPPRSVALKHKRTTMRFDPFTGETPSVAG
jgi:hypothetical protein